MTFSRRGFLAAGAATAGMGVGAARGEAAPLGGGRSVTDFGVQPGTEAVQTAALQRAIDEITHSGHAVFLPGGHYATGTLKLPAGCAITGPGSAAVLHATAGGTVFEAQLPAAALLTLAGLALDGGAAAGSGKPGGPLAALSGGDVNLACLRLVNASGAALHLEACSGYVQNITVEGAAGAGILARDAGTLTVAGCHVSACRAEGIGVTGSAVVTGNFVSRSRFGLRLGGHGEGQIMATGNLLRECGIGIGVTASGETLLVSINLINEPKESAIRAFDGDRLVGPDLARQSAESYLNLTVAGNVVR